MTYVTPADMRELYDEVMLVQITNYSNRAATEINEPLLQSACDNGGRLIEGYLLSWGIRPEDFSDGFRAILKTHAARLAMDFLAGTDPQVRDQARETMEWLKSLNRLSRDALENLVLAPPLPGEEPVVLPDGVVLPSLAFEGGREWRVTF